MSLIMRRSVTLFVLIILTGGSMLAQVNIRLGGSVGNGLNKGLFELDGEDFRIDKTDLGWKAYFSANWQFLGFEVDYRNLGTVEVSNSVSQGSSRSQGIDLFATGNVNLGPFMLFGKAGPYIGKTRNELYTLSASTIMDDIQTEAFFAWGIGAGLNISFLHLRIEYEKLHLQPTELAILSFGAGINF